MIDGKFKLFFISAVLALVALFLLNTPKVLAAYDGANLISNNVYLHSQSMSKEDIQNFLAAKGGGLASRSYTLSCYGPESKERQWYTAAGATCDQNIPASHIIYYASQIYGINPKVTLATLQKEQSLITSSNPTAWQLDHAMGYGCPTSGSCSTSNFSAQIDSGVWVLRYHYERARGNNTWWNNNSNWTCGTEKNFYKPSLYPNQNVRFYDQDGVEYRTHFIVNAATSALYCYTPHTFNNHANGVPAQGVPIGTLCYPSHPVNGTVGRCYTGSYNFVKFFELWFGSVYGLDYDWNYEGISFSSGSANLDGGQQVTVTISAKNLGSQSWSNSNYPVRIGTFKPTDHNSALYDSSWVSQTRPATLNQAIVMPGETGTFTFKINVPNRANELYIECFNLVAEGSTWMPHRDFSIQLNITKQNYKWQMVSQSSTNGFRLNPSQSSQFTLVAKNTGNTTWTNTGNAVKLATWAPSYRRSAFDPGTWENPYRLATLQEASVAPGANGTFVFNVRAPSTPGFYIERLNLVMEGVSWMEDPWVEYQVDVGNFYAWQMVSQDSSTGSFSLPRNSTATFTLTARNTGNVTWTNSANPVRLATWAPPYRTSVFNPNNGSWVNAYRAATLNEASVAPSQTGTFTFNVKAPSTPGFYVERFNLVMEGVAWFHDPWLEFDVSVL